MYFVAMLGPIEIGRITVLNDTNPYFVTVNAVAAKPTTQQLPESHFVKSFVDFEIAKAYAISFFPDTTRPFILWTTYN